MQISELSMVAIEGVGVENADWLRSADGGGGCGEISNRECWDKLFFVLVLVGRLGGHDVRIWGNLT